MRIDVIGFDPPKHLDGAAQLLAERQARDRARDERLPAVYEVPAACRPLIEQALATPSTEAVVAMAGGEMVGFGIMSGFLANPTHMTASFFPARCVNWGYTSHAAKAGMEYDAYREMYAALSDRFVDNGYFWHNVYVAPRDEAVVDAMSSLGFGRTLTCAVRDVGPVDADGVRGVEIHEAASEDGDVVAALNDELMAHHARAPIFWPHLPETEASSREFQDGLLQEPSKNAHFVAYDNGKPVGMNTFMAPSWLAPTACPEKTIYLYQGIVSEQSRGGGVGKTVLKRGVGWAREQGYEYVALHFAAPNVSGARFWLGNGFIPVEYRMTRTIDDRISWAK
jgi:GNAT superfamily N-acetyltransferase